VGEWFRGRPPPLNGWTGKVCAWPGLVAGPPFGADGTDPSANLSGLRPDAPEAQVGLTG